MSGVQYIKASSIKLLSDNAIVGPTPDRQIVTTPLVPGVYSDFVQGVETSTVAPFTIPADGGALIIPNTTVSNIDYPVLQGLVPTVYPGKYFPIFSRYTGPPSIPPLSTVWVYNPIGPQDAMPGGFQIDIDIRCTSQAASLNALGPSSASPSTDPSLAISVQFAEHIANGSSFNLVPSISLQKNGDAPIFSVVQPISLNTFSIKGNLHNQTSLGEKIVARSVVIILENRTNAILDISEVKLRFYVNS